MKKNSVSVTVMGKTGGNAENLSKKGLALLSILKKSGVSFEVFLVDGKIIRQLNKKYRKRDEATNVLSFEAPKSFPVLPISPKSLGEIYICPGYIKSHGEDMDAMLIHGLLHLLGYDHESKNDMIKMQAKEKLLLNKLKTKN